MKEKLSTPRTHYIHRTSYSAQERIVGVFVLVALFILLGLLLSSGKSKNIFDDHITIYGELQSIQAVNKDAEVIISGLPAGTVVSVDINDKNKVVLTMKILNKYHKLLRADSKATLSSFNFAVVQKSVVEITAGSIDKKTLEDGSTIEINEAFNIKEMMAKIEPIFITLHDSIQKIDNVLSAIDHEKLENTLNNINTLTANLSEVSKQISSGKGLIGSVIYEEEMEANARAIAINIIDVTEEADKTIKASQQIWPLSSAIEKNTNTDILTSPAPAND